MPKAIIVGASSGIGEALAHELILNQYTVGITGRRSENLKTLQAVAPDKFVTRSFDCTTAQNADELNALVSELGGLDLLIISSGTGEINHTLNPEIENNTNALNVIAFTEMVDWAYRYFQSQGKGQIAAITSIAGLRGGRHAPAYGASKAYQINYLEALRQKAQKEKLALTVTDLRPGFVDTPMAQGEGQFWVASPKKAAKQIFRHIQRKKSVAYVTHRWRLIALLLKALPRAIYNRV